MNRDSFPVMLMLFAGAMTSIIVFIKDYSLSYRMVALVISLLVFYALGSIIRYMLNRFDKENRDRRDQEAREKKEAEEKAKKALEAHEQQQQA